MLACRSVCTNLLNVHCKVCFYNLVKDIIALPTKERTLLLT
jgi:hypothetical protein